MHDEDFEHEHELLASDPAARAWSEAIAKSIEEQDTLVLLTVGIDIGSSTSHLLFARVTLNRQTHDLSSRFVVVDRQIVWQSPIIHTPFRPDGLIDSHELAHFIRRAYDDAGFVPEDVDSGAVILTGEAIKRPNARAIDEIFASESGKFVCATAGHELESLLAAHGSGATALSRERGVPSLHVDIGGGTTKLALLDRGEVLDVAAFAVGGRLLAQDAEGRWTRRDDSALLVAEDLGIDLTPEAAADPGVRRQICERLAQVVVDEITGTGPDALGRSLELTRPLRRSAEPSYLTFSGGVSEYVFGHETAEYGDIAAELARQIIRQLGERVSIPSIDAGQRIRATVIGASQYTVQVSGKTIYLAGDHTDHHGHQHTTLPLRNVPVVHLGALDTGSGTDGLDAADVAAVLRHAAELRGADLAGTVAVAFAWDGLPSYAALHELARGIADGIGHAHSHDAVVLVVDGDIGQVLGRILDIDVALGRPVVSVDGVELKELDYVDVGELVDPPGVVPVIIKSLLFS